ncbi:hypothetical protein [Halovivax limisalsi]|uniref:hypothetical protein n=1 Tax=Halovivax limisalsi TaxID=1453760 RepID=UPI001FFC2D6E|nr:hypothetical protein [Halovivax limisalsi]
MNALDRRSVLRYGAGGLGVSLAGCLSDFSSGSGDGGDDGGDGSDLTVDVFQLGATGERPIWYRDDDRRGAVTVVDSSRDRPWHGRFEGGGSSERRDDLRSWLEATDFDSSVVCYVETVAPNTCYTEVAVADVRVETATIDRLGGEREVIAGTVEAIDTSGANEACGQLISYPAAVVRITPDDGDADLPSIAQFEIVDGWGEASTENSVRGIVSPSDLPGFVRPSGDPPAIPDALSCPDETFERLPSTGDDETVYGETVDEDGRPLYAMRVVNPAVDSSDADADDALAFERGDAVEIVLRNVSNRELHAGNAAKYNFEVQTAAGWQDVRGVADGDGFGYTDEAYAHQPGDGYEWSFAFDESGVVADSVRAGELSVCPDLQTGRYRFRFWSVEGADSIAVAFDLVD